MVLSFGIPFALFPLLAVTRDASVTGTNVSGRVVSGLLAGASLAITGLNLYSIGQLIAAIG